MTKKGFTMIELLAAIVILGILSVIAIASVTRLIDKSKKAESDTYEKVLIMAGKSYMESNKTELPKRI